MAEGFARAYGSDVLVPASAGLMPAGQVAPDTARAMLEKNITLRDHFPKHIRQLGRARFDLIVNMSGADLETVPGDSVISWDVTDPIRESYERHCEIRDEIERLVMNLVLDASPQESPDGGAVVSREFDFRSGAAIAACYAPLNETKRNKMPDNLVCENADSGLIIGKNFKNTLKMRRQRPQQAVDRPCAGAAAASSQNSGTFRGRSSRAALFLIEIWLILPLPLDQLPRSPNIEAIAKLEESFVKNRRLAERIADWIARFFGEPEIRRDPCGVLRRRGFWSISGR